MHVLPELRRRRTCRELSELRRRLGDPPDAVGETAERVSGVDWESAKGRRVRFPLNSADRSGDRLVEINGMAHVILTAGDFKASAAFYRDLLPFLGMSLVADNDEILYGVGARTALGIMPPADEYAGERFVQRRVGLHHLCFRAKDRESIDEAFEYLKAKDATIVHGPEEGPWAPGYYSILFEDPDGVRLEINYVPGKGLFNVGGRLMGV